MKLNLTRLDVAALLTIGFLITTLSIVLLMGNPVELNGALLNAQEGGSVGPLGPLHFRFTKPVIPEKVEDQFRIEPNVTGHWVVVDEKQYDFIPDSPFTPGVSYRVSFSAAALGVNGERLHFDHKWHFRVRPLQVLYLAGQAAQRELWLVGLDGSPALQFTYSSGRVYDFAVAPDGENIALSLFNDQKGIDLWLIDRAGKNGRILLACGASRCSTPAWSPDGQYVAYTREAAPFGPGAPQGAPRLRMIHLSTNQDLPIYSDPQVIGYGPSWSPDGGRIASWDGVNGGIRVLNLKSGEQVLLPTETGAVGGWSPDGTQMLFTRYEPVDQGYHAFVYRADFTNGEVSTFLEGGEEDSAYGTPIWSPSGDQIAFSLRYSASSPARSIWIVRSDYLSGPMIGSNTNYTHSFYSWDPWGTALVFQRMRLGGDSGAEIAIYQLATGKIQVLAEGGGWPQWLP